MTTYHVPGMHCGGCRATVERALKGSDPDARVAFDAEARTVAVDSRLDDDALRRAIEASGYELAA